MGNTTWIDVFGRPGKETHSDLGALHRLDKQLDGLAEKLGVTKLTAFYDYRELLKAYGDEDLPAPSWFDPERGLETFSALRLRLTEDSDALGPDLDKTVQNWPDDLVQELSYCQSILDHAVSKRQRFRLLIVP